MLVFRYLFKEVFYTLLALTVILLLVFLSNQMIQYMNRAASGQIPVMFLLKLLVIEMPNLLSLLLPLGFYIALIVAYGRLYAESEMTVLHACGYGYWTLLRHSFLMAAGVAALVLAIMVYLSPSIATQRVTLLRTSGVQFFLKTVAPERFNSTFPGHVFYIDSIDKKNQQAQHVFVAKKSPTGWDVILANKAGIKTLASGEAILELKQGAFYRGQAGLANYQTATFADYQATLPKAEIDVSSDVRTLSTAKLLPWNNPDLKKAAELQWRLSIPLMVLTLTVMAIPLSRVNPRQGKYAKLLPAILLFMLYANFMFVARSWVEQGKVSTWIGVWWLHLAMVLLAVLLILYQKRKPV